MLLRAHNYRRTGENELAEEMYFSKGNSSASRPQDNVWTEAKYRDFSEFSAHSLPKVLFVASQLPVEVLDGQVGFR